MSHLKGCIAQVMGAVQYRKIALHCPFRGPLKLPVNVFNCASGVHRARLLNLIAVNLCGTCHQRHWQPLRKRRGCFLSPRVGVNSGLKRTKIHSNEGGRAVWLMQGSVQLIALFHQGNACESTRAPLSRV